MNSNIESDCSINPESSILILYNYPTSEGDNASVMWSLWHLASRECMLWLY